MPGRSALRNGSAPRAMAERLRLTRERLRQIQAEALNKLKRRMARQGVERHSLF